MKDADQQIIQILREIEALQGGGATASWGAITGTLSNQTDLQAALDAKPGYKVYTALLTQTSTDAPVATVLQNTLGGTVVWAYDGSGSYHATLAGAFTANKTTPVSEVHQFSGAEPLTFNSTRFVFGGRSDNNTYALQTFQAGSQADDLLSGFLLRIEVYP